MTTLAVTLVAVPLAAAGPAAAEPSLSSMTGRTAADLRVQRFASPNPGSVNAYWLHAPQGLILIDTLRSPADARKALARVRDTGQPVVAILLTHVHPDHVGGAGLFHRAFPQAPIYASEASAKAMRQDSRGLYALTRSLPGSDFPKKLTYPTKIFRAGTTLRIAGLTIRTAEFPGGESDAATVYHEPRSRSLFVGDLLGNRVTPALIEGNSCGWLSQLERLRTSSLATGRAYPGHGAPAPARGLITWQQTYLKRFRKLVKPAVAENSPAGPRVTGAERRTIIAATKRAYPGHPLVASLPTLMEENVKAVAAEIASTDPAKLPRICR
ncbi:MBL fold metallo-hydrolase [Nonomuraea candida]|uniref:MBL fold metallo-hydrolase n=1 Tax=Nonomuraea candida TaxID=359159 RepID=UPI001B80E420|nr:MBL fold metallo-hydrolase [Nonomuraea candida]